MKQNKLFISEREASQRYGFSVAWFRRSRWIGDGPQFLKIGAKVLYPLEDTDQWFLSHQLRNSTSSNRQEERKN